MELNLNWFDTECVSNLFGENKKIYVKIYCKGLEAELFGMKYDRRYFSDYIVFINLLTIFGFGVYLTLSRITENKTIGEFEKNKPSPMSYSLKLVGLPNNCTEQEMIKNLY